LKVVCGRTGDEEVYEDDESEEQGLLFDESMNESSDGSFHWSQLLLQSFREELEKLVILDYLMLNTDRGADNYMLRFCEGSHEKSFVDVAPARSAMPIMSELKSTSSAVGSPLASGSRTGMTGHVAYTAQPHIHIAAIDNSLSFPHEHPRGWRSYTYGWLFLPVGVIGRPFSERIRRELLPLLTSKEWWEETTFQLRKLFALDPDFHPKMFARQMAVVKGQAWNIVQSLKHSDEGPLELTRRIKVLVWDDEIEVADVDGPDTPQGDGMNLLSQSVGELPRPPPPLPRSRHHKRSRSAGFSEFPPPLRRATTDIAGMIRPVPFAAKFQRINPGASGVTVLEHMERLDAIEAGLKRLGMEESVLEEEPEEGDVVDSARQEEEDQHADQDIATAVQEDEELVSPSARSEPSFLIGIDAGVPEAVSPPQPSPHVRWADMEGGSERHSIDMSVEEEVKKRIVIMERLETINTRPFFSCW